ncbi:MAG TPA: hypothetical protein VKP65_24725 [Rhodothermales bacterium]|nr:hypothetical protein [Rhodothermales bacterium]
MKDLIHELLPHAPQMGLYVAPNIPEQLVQNALGDYAGEMKPDEVVALYDATLMGNAKDGAVFAINRFIFQNNDLQHPQVVRYEDLVRVDKKRSLLKGAKILLEVNRGRATFDLELDCSGKPKASEFIYRFLHEAMMRPMTQPEVDDPWPGERTPAGTDLAALQKALDKLRMQGILAAEDFERIMDIVRGA